MPAKLSHSQYVQRVKDIHGTTITVLGTYTTVMTNIAHRCNECQHIWSPKPNDVTNRRQSCPICCYKRRYVTPHPKMPARYTNDQYVARLFAVNSNVLPIELYVRSNIKILHRCLRCNNEWKITPNNTLNKHGCPACKVESNSFKRYDYKLGNRNVQVQGYEPQALDWLLKRGVTPSKLLVSTLEGKPSISYKHKGKVKLYVPDFYHTTLNRIIEVKSTYTLGLGRRSIKKNWTQMKAKAKACIASGYSFSLLIMHQNGTRINFPRDWYLYTHKELVKFL